MTKDELITKINEYIIDNNVGQITPAVLREILTDISNSPVESGAENITIKDGFGLVSQAENGDPWKSEINFSDGLVEISSYSDTSKQNFYISDEEKLIRLRVSDGVFEPYNSTELALLVNGFLIRNYSGKIVEWDENSEYFSGLNISKPLGIDSDGIHRIIKSGDTPGLIGRMEFYNQGGGGFLFDGDANGFEVKCDTIVLHGETEMKANLIFDENHGIKFGDTAAEGFIFKNGSVVTFICSGGFQFNGNIGVSGTFTAYSGATINNATINGKADIIGSLNTTSFYNSGDSNLTGNVYTEANFITDNDIVLNNDAAKIRCNHELTIAADEKLVVSATQIDFSALPEFVDNESAIAGGLSTGLLYKSSGTIKIVV